MKKTYEEAELNIIALNDDIATGNADILNDSTPLLDFDIEDID